MKLRALAVVTAAMVLATTMTAFAGQWKNGVLRTSDWWYDNGDGTWPAAEWVWIDSDNDGIAECYYFDEDGWLLTSREAPDHYVTNEDGQWTLAGEVQHKAVQ